jgi:hypothetical protein
MYFVIRQRCISNQWLHFHGNTEHFHIVDIDVTPTTIKMEGTVAFPCQQWLRKSRTMSHCTKFVHLPYNWGFHGRDYKDCCQMEDNVMWSGRHYRRLYEKMSRSRRPYIAVHDIWISACSCDTDIHFVFTHSHTHVCFFHACALCH